MLSPVFIIGAGRSGTNILRDSLTSFDSMVTWPCDEINLVFRHGNHTMSHDEFDKEQANQKAKNFILQTFQKLQNQYPESKIVEKTCANSLRVPFLCEISPQARFIFIVRNGFDVTASSKKRWTARMEPSYLWKKLQFVPKSDIPYYTIKFLENRLKQVSSKENRLGKWGPVYKGMEEDLMYLSVLEIAAKQWAKCVEKAYYDLLKIEQDRVFFMTYEYFVQYPRQTLGMINRWLGENWSSENIEYSVKDIRVSSLGKGLNQFKGETNLIAKYIDPVMKNIYDKVEGQFKKDI